MADENFIQALIEVGAEAKAAQMKEAGLQREIDRLNDRLNSERKYTEELEKRVVELKQDAAAQEANLRLDFGRRITAFENERNDLVKERDRLKNDFYDLQVRFEQRDRDWMRDYSRIQQRYDFARKFISAKGLGRIFGAAIRKFTPKNNY